jgi:hypothetical protein
MSTQVNDTAVRTSIVAAAPIGHAFSDGWQKRLEAFARRLRFQSTYGPL